MMNARLNHLFSIPLMEFEYGQISEDENNIINHYLNDLRPNVYNFTTRESYILDKEKGLSNLKKFIYRAIYTYVKSVIVGDEYNQDELKFKITGTKGGQWSGEDVSWSYVSFPCNIITFSYFRSVLFYQIQ